MSERSFGPEPVAGNYFVSAYPPFSCWSEDGAEEYTASLEQAPASKEPRPFGLYIHIPFCAQRCLYCYYLAHAGRLGDAGDYLAALGAELAYYIGKPRLAGRPLSFVYFGGGTPSLLSLSQLQRLFHDLQAVAGWVDVEEATFECAPRSVTASKLRTIHEAGITRLSLGIQQLNDEVLRGNGRVHRVSDVLRAYELIRQTGFETVNVDLIVGLVGETEASFLGSLERVIELAPDSITLYQLEIPLSTPLFRALSDGSLKAAPPDWDTKHERLGRGFAMLEDAGYSVTTAYCAVRDPDKHRFIYQQAQYQGSDVLGIGASAFSYIGGFHQQNLVRLEAYIERLSAGRLPIGRVYPLQPRERLVREFLLQLKLGQVDLRMLRERHGADPIEILAPRLESFCSEGWLQIEQDRVTLTRKGLLRVDRLIPRLYLPEHRVARYS